MAGGGYWGEVDGGLALLEKREEEEERDVLRKGMESGGFWEEVKGLCQIGDQAVGHVDGGQAVEEFP